ncbi:Inorganic pyrophosphatase 3 [Hibiscus syriacus]|uniref:Inorganic pyrophosphatase 3 n=1 Tax=Hibiscus syriacus TaxID=106335 RepID=A0A6A3BDU4_HIBSY|nr:Inorganic pyrophosphatase 3 [Hibiscus syriacus]
MPPKMTATVTVVIFYFDRTLIDGDSDRWVVTEMGLLDLFNQLRSTLPWNSLMDRMMKELHSQGKTADDIAESLKKTPVNPRTAAAIKSAYALGCDLRILSDANQFFIDKILEHHGLLGCFSKIYTNPSYVEEGRLRIFPYLHMAAVYVQLICARQPNFIYLGDGSGDYCPTLKLRDSDYVMPRKNYPLWNRIFSDRASVKAEVHEWSNGEELERILLHLINRISSE